MMASAQRYYHRLQMVMDRCFINLSLCLVVLLVSTEASYKFGKIRKRKDFILNENDNETVATDNIAMYFTRRTTPWPRMKFTVDPSIEAYYEMKDKKEYFIKHAYFKKEKQKKKERKKIETPSDF